MEQLGRAEAAARYAAYGWMVVPFHWIASPGRCSCGCESAGCSSPREHPLVPLEAASRDAATVRSWWEHWPEANSSCLASPAWWFSTSTRSRRPGRRCGAWRDRRPGRAGHAPGTVGRRRLARNFRRAERDAPAEEAPPGDAGVHGHAGIIVWPSSHASGGSYAWHGCSGPWERAPLPAPERLLRDLAASPGVRLVCPQPASGRSALRAGDPPDGAAVAELAGRLSGRGAQGTRLVPSG